MELKDIFTILISLAALALSFIVFVRNLFYDKITIDLVFIESNGKSSSWKIFISNPLRNSIYLQSIEFGKNTNNLVSKINKMYDSFDDAVSSGLRQSKSEGNKLRDIYLRIAPGESKEINLEFNSAEFSFDAKFIWVGRNKLYSFFLLPKKLSHSSAQIVSMMECGGDRNNFSNSQ